MAVKQLYSPVTLPPSIDGILIDAVVLPAPLADPCVRTRILADGAVVWEKEVAATGISRAEYRQCGMAV